METLTIPEIVIFTDGSANPQHKIGAWAALIKETSAITLSGCVTNVNHQQMELKAVLEALKYLDTKSYQCRTIIYTDSQYVADLPKRKIKLFAQNFITSKGKAVANAELLITIYQYLERHDLQFIKIPAHQKKDTGYNENRLVDKLTRKLVREKVKKIESNL